VKRTKGRKRQSTLNRHPNGKINQAPRAAQHAEALAQAKQRNTAISGHPDLPTDCLGILRGHDQITEQAYQEGRRLERLMARIYDTPSPSPSAMFKESVSPPSPEEAASSAIPMSEEDAQAMMEKMLAKLLRIGTFARDKTLGAIRYNHGPRAHLGETVYLRDLAAIKEGLELLAEHLKPRKATSPRIAQEAA